MVVQSRGKVRAVNILRVKVFLIKFDEADADDAKQID